MRQEGTSKGSIFVTGGTGFIGQAVVNALLEAGYPVRCMIRVTSPKAAWKGALEATVGDIREKASFEKAVRECWAVIHLVGIIVESRGSTFEAIHVGGTRNVVEAAVEAGVKKFIHMSALGTRPTARSQYHQTKWRGEEIVRGCGLDYTIFRPSIIFGPGDEFFSQLARLLRRMPVFPVVGSGEYRMQPVWLGDLVRILVAGLSTPGALGQAIEVGGPEQLSYNEMIASLMEVTGVHRPTVHLPLGLVRPLVSIMGFLPRPPVTRDQLTMLLEDNVCDLSQVRSMFGIEPLVSLREGLSQYLGASGGQ